MNVHRTRATIVAIALLCGVSTASAKTLVFQASLDGRTAPTHTGSKATGRATIRVDLKQRSVSVDLRVAGIPLAGLWDRLVAAPVGPIHFHKYGTQDHSGDDVVLVMPIPYGPAYRATANGFRVRLTNYAYATGAGLVQSDASFDSFITALQSGTVVLNIHTDQFQDGEISGTVVKS